MFHSRQESESSVESTRSPVSEALIFVCEKCGGSVSRELAKAIKRAAKDGVGKRAVRAVLTDCMSLCPKRAIAVTLATAHGASSFVTVEESANMDRAADELIQRAIQSPKSSR